jgi:uncharacterized protein
MIIYAYVLTAFTLPEWLADKGRAHAEKIEAEELEHPSPENMTWWQKLTSAAGWKIISFKFFG